MKSRKLRVVMLLGALVVATQGLARAERFTERFEQTYQLGLQPEITLSNTNGNVSVEAWDRPEVELVAEKRLDSSSPRSAAEALAKIEIVVREGDGRLEIETEYPGASSGFLDWLFGRARNASVRYELRVPREATLDVRTVNGRIDTDGAGGTQRLRSTNGGIRVEDARRTVEAHTTNGAIDVEVTKAATSRLDVELGSTNGGITVALPADLRADLEARTVNGSVRTDVPIAVRGASNRRRIVGELNGGGPGRIALKTTNGSIRIRQAGR